MKFFAELSKLDEVLEYVSNTLKKYENDAISDEIVSKVCFLVDELFSNIALYAGEPGTVRVEISLSFDDDGNLIV